MHPHVIGTPVQFFPGRDQPPHAGQIVHAHDDGRACVVAWCRDSQAFREHADLPCGTREDGPFFRHLQEAG